MASERIPALGRTSARTSITTTSLPGRSKPDWGEGIQYQDKNLRYFLPSGDSPRGQRAVSPVQSRTGEKRGLASVLPFIQPLSSDQRERAVKRFIYEKGSSLLLAFGFRFIREIIIHGKQGRLYYSGIILSVLPLAG